MADPFAEWHAEHVNFARLLDLLEGQIAAFHRDEHPNYELMGDIVYYLQSYGDTVHHPREDVAFARLAARAPAMELTIARVQQEHRVLMTAAEALRNCIAEANSDVMAPRAALEAAAATYLVYYRHHLNTEERDIMPRAAGLLTQEDWAAVAAVSPIVSDPLFGHAVEARMMALRQQIATQAGLGKRR